MNMTAAQLKKIDPLHALIAGGFVSGTKHPLPLVATRFDVDLNRGLAMTLTNLNGRAQLRIPLTVGDIYGRSGLPDSDDLTYGGPVQTAELAVRCRDGEVTLLGGRLDNGRAQVPLNAPIDLEVHGWTPGELRGRAADGREVVLRVEPAPFGDAGLNAAVLIDHSGSMGEICSLDDRSMTKHQSVLAGLQKIAARIGQSDVIDLWEFDNTHHHVGSARGRNALQSLIGKLSEPAGGTEIGTALAGVTALSQAHDVLLVTDGKSHALDVQALARSGRRFSVVLVGEDSLEANVGHLAALTGGEIFVSAGADLAEVLNAALLSLRTKHQPVGPITGRPQRLLVRRAGMTLAAEWREAKGPTEGTAEMRAVTALAASIALPALDSESAAQFAESEGLVTHLTSLVLVDEEGAAQEGLPATRKVALPAPRLMAQENALAVACLGGPKFDLLSDRIFSRAAAPKPSRAFVPTIAPEPTHADLSGLIGRIDWDAAPQQLQAADLSTLDREVALAIRSAAAIPEVVAFARQLGVDPVALVVGLIARSESSTSRSAARLAKAILGDIAREGLDHIAQMLGLKGGPMLQAETEALPRPTT
jgi:hypothetical protein